jgi:hypothetical protein
MSSLRFVVRELLARHLDREASTIHAGDQIERDLDLTPLELVMVAVELEELEALGGTPGVELGVEGLAAVRTVGELYAYFRRAVGRARRVRRVGDGVASAGYSPSQ